MWKILNPTAIKFCFLKFLISVIKGHGTKVLAAADYCKCQAGSSPKLKADTTLIFISPPNFSQLADLLAPLDFIMKMSPEHQTKHSLWHKAS